MNLPTTAPVICAVYALEASLSICQRMGGLHACAAAQLLRHGIKLVQGMLVGVHCGSNELTACQTFSDFECRAASLARLFVFCDLLSIFKGELLLEEVFFRFVDDRLY